MDAGAADVGDGEHPGPAHPAPRPRRGGGLEPPHRHCTHTLLATPLATTDEYD